MDYNIDDYPLLINKVIKYIEKVKRKEKNISMSDIIIDFSIKKNIDIDLLGDAISTDAYLKSYIEKDCEVFRIFRSNINNDEW